MYYPRKIPEHFLKTTAETEPSIPLITREQIRHPQNFSPLVMVLLLEFLSTKKDG
jgi:hypothetical protein